MKAKERKQFASVDPNDPISVRCSVFLSVEVCCSVLQCIARALQSSQ